MKVLIVARYADRRGGADVYTEALATKLAARGHDVSIVCHSASPKVHAGCSVTEIAEPNFSETRALWRLAPFFYQRHWQRSIARLRIPQPDVMISTMVLSSGDLQRRFPATPWVYLPHSRIAPIEAVAIESKSRVQRSIARRLYGLHERRSLLQASTTVRFTSGNERILRDHYKLPANTNFQVIPAPVEHIQKEAKRTVSTPVCLVSVGRLIEGKNLLWLLRELSALRSSPWRWTIAGDGPQRFELQQEAKRLGVADRVNFLGRCENITQVYQAADLHLFPSRLESLGLVVLEAMGFGVPTVAFRPDGDRFQTVSDEVISAGVDGFLAEGEQDFMRQVQRCLAQPDRLLSIGEAGRQKVTANHVWDKVVVAWESILRDCIDGAPSARSAEVAHA